MLYLFPKIFYTVNQSVLLCLAAQLLFYPIKCPYFFLINNVFVCVQLQELGRLCGLQPGCSESSSDQLHTVIALVCGMGDDPHQLMTHASSAAAASSADKLRSALDSDLSSESDLSSVDGNCTSKRKTGIAGALQPGESGLQASAVASMESGSECVASFGVAILEQDHMTPMTRLKEALSSKEAFRKHYLVRKNTNPFFV